MDLPLIWNTVSVVGSVAGKLGLGLDAKILTNHLDTLYWGV